MYGAISYIVSTEKALHPTKLLLTCEKPFHPCTCTHSIVLQYIQMCIKPQYSKSERSICVHSSAERVWISSPGRSIWTVPTHSIITWRETKQKSIFTHIDEKLFRILYSLSLRHGCRFMALVPSSICEWHFGTQPSSDEMSEWLSLTAFFGQQTTRTM